MQEFRTGVITHLIIPTSGSREAVVRSSLRENTPLGHFKIHVNATVRAGLPVEILDTPGGVTLRDPLRKEMIGIPIR